MVGCTVLIPSAVLLGKGPRDHIYQKTLGNGSWKPLRRSRSFILDSNSFTQMEVILIILVKEHKELKFVRLRPVRERWNHPINVWPMSVARCSWWLLNFPEVQLCWTQASASPALIYVLCYHVSLVWETPDLCQSTQSLQSLCLCFSYKSRRY